MKMQCPICDIAVLHEAKVCPQCDSDLDVFNMISNPEPAPTATQATLQASLPVAPAGSLSAATPTSRTNLNSNPKGLITKSPRIGPNWSWWLLGILSLGAVGIVMAFVYQLQVAVLEELKNERMSRFQAEERSTQVIGKLTEKLIEKTNEAHNATMAALVLQNQEQQQTINDVREQIGRLEDTQRQNQKQRLRLRQTLKPKSPGSAQKDSGQ